MNDHDHYKFQAEVLGQLRELRRAVGRNEKRLEVILDILRHKSILSKARVTVMPKTISVGETATATIQGLDQFGKAFPLDATYQVVYNQSNPADATFATPGPDGTALLTANVADTDIIGATITRPDGSVVTAGTDTLTINPPVAVLTTANVVLQ